jgi:DNA-binding winged helix-turn-helix (wHTH) protein/tetratricopeptide (TPR) repeat protein
LKASDSDSPSAVTGHLTNESAPFAVGDWRVDPALRQIARGTEVVRVDPRNMRVLQLLASRGGEIVSQGDIEKIAWSGVVVTPDSVYQSIKQLRRAFGERRYIETVPRKGYRLAMPVSHEPPASVLAASPPPRSMRHRLLWGASIALAAAVGIGVLAWFVRTGEKILAMEPVAQAAAPQSYQGDVIIRKAIASLEKQRDAAGSDDAALVTTLSRLSNLYLLVSDPRQSAKASQGGLVILEKGAGTRSDEGVELHATLAEALADLEQFEDAESHLQTALNTARELHGEAHETTVAALQQLALLRIAQQRYEDAEQMARLALDVHRRLPEPGTASAAHLTSTLAWALIEQGRASEAIAPLDEALAAIKPDDPPAPYLVALAHHFRGEALNHLERHAEAEQAFRTELALFATIQRVRMDEARAISALAETRLMQGAAAEAAELLGEARSLLKDGEGWRERRARQENEARLSRLRELNAHTPAGG